MDNNWLKASFLSQILNAKDTLSDLESNTSFEAGSKISSKVKFDREVDLFLGVLITKIDQDRT